jgi:hypothetical protein
MAVSRQNSIHRGTGRLWWARMSRRLTDRTHKSKGAILGESQNAGRFRRDAEDGGDFERCLKCIFALGPDHSHEADSSSGDS